MQVLWEHGLGNTQQLTDRTTFIAITEKQRETQRGFPAYEQLGLEPRSAGLQSSEWEKPPWVRTPFLGPLCLVGISVALLAEIGKIQLPEPLP